VLNTTFADNTVQYPLSEELERAIERFVDSHDRIEDSDSQKLQDELLSIFNRHVVNNSDKQGPFVAVLRLLRPAIRGERRLDEWWQLLIKPIIDAIGHNRNTIEDAREFLLGILVFDVEDDITGQKAALSQLFTKKLLDAYLARTNLPSPYQIVSPQDEFLAHELENILVAFGRRNPKVLTYLLLTHPLPLAIIICHPMLTISRNSSLLSTKSWSIETADFKHYHC
jgi:hypothetical protein